MNSRLITFLLSVIISLNVFGAEVNWSYKLLDDGTDHPSVTITAEIAPGFHLYAVDNPEGGAGPLVFNFDTKGCELVGTVTADKKYKVEYNDIFEVDEHYYDGKVTFTQKIKPTAEKYSVNIDVKGQACNDTGCFQVFGSKLFTGTVPAALLKTDKTADANPKTNPETNPETKSLNPEATEIAEFTDSLQSATAPLVPGDTDLKGVRGSWWDNVEAEMAQFSEAPTQQERSLLYIFIAGFIGGLIALLTPCVWPMIPTTVSFFLKQKGASRRSAITKAVTYGASIIVIYVVLGLLITIIFGASALNELATSALFNLLFFLLLVIFGFSFLGGFEITLPSSWANKIDAKVDKTTGLLSIFFMAFTLALVSFSCTGPIIGTLLVEAAATSNFISPAVGMFGFALALALPFTLFALFPSLLQSRPKAGAWMNSVKVVLGFLELALALKFLSVADLAYGWRILDREVFVALWIVIFGLLGAYLLGKITFPHDSKLEKIGVGRFSLAVITLAFTVYMIPGLWGAPLKAISAFTPPMTTQDFSLYEDSFEAHTNDFELAMEMGRAQNKPVLIDFSGYGCVNCRKMEAAVWTDSRVRDIMKDDYIVVTLMVDDKKPLPQPIEVEERDGTRRTLRTYGDKWSYLERNKFGANAQPYYVAVDADGKPLTGAYSYNENVSAFTNFLTTGVRNFKKSE